MKNILFVLVLFSAMLFMACVGGGQPKPKGTVFTFDPGQDEYVMELEQFDLTDCPVIDDPKASGGKAILLESSKSKAIGTAVLPAGRYIGYVNEFSPGPESDAFYVILNGKYYRCYPSDPPTGDWERTTRVPMSITLSETKEYNIVVQPNSPQRQGETGMKLDYIVFVPQK